MIQPKVMNYPTLLSMIERLPKSHPACPSLLRRKYDPPKEASISSWCDNALNSGYLSRTHLTKAEKKEHGIAPQSTRKYTMTEKGMDFLAENIDEVHSDEDIKILARGTRAYKSGRKPSSNKGRLSKHSLLASQAFEQALLLNQDSLEFVKAMKNQLVPIMMQMQQFIDEAEREDQDEQETE